MPYFRAVAEGQGRTSLAGTKDGGLEVKITNEAGDCLHIIVWHGCDGKDKYSVSTHDGRTPPARFAFVADGILGGAADAQTD